MNNIRIINELPPEAYENELVAIDLEIYGIPEEKLHRPVGEFACASVFLERDSLYVDNELPVYQIYDTRDLPALIQRLHAGRWVFQNGKFDIRQLRRWVDIPPRPIWDTMVVDQGLWGGYYATFDLASLSIRYLNTFMDKETREEFATRKEMTPDMKRYAAQDPVTTMMVAVAQMQMIADTDRTMTHYWKADHPALWAILDMKPVKVNMDGWAELGREFEAKRGEIDARYGDFNLGSTQQVNRRLCDLLGRRNLFKSVDEDHLTEQLDIAVQHGNDQAAAFIKDVLARRKYQTYASRYGVNWVDRYLEDEFWINADWKPVEAKTGRMACGSPNLQQVPSREFPIYRTFFVADDGCIILLADVEQQEPRILAKLSGDKFLIDILRRGLSPHVMVGAEIFKDPDFSKKDPRYSLAKQANLGTSYGMTAQGLASKAGVPVDEAEEFLEHYFRLMPGVKAYIQRYRSSAYRMGYVETLLGRRSYINPYSRKWENNAINSPIQGTAADQTKIAIGFIHKESKLRGLPFCLSMVVHDEVVCCVPNELEKDYRQLIEDAWQEAGRLTLEDTVPMKIELASGQNWGCKH